jgi:hypothetical protein
MLRFIEGFDHCGLAATQAQLRERLQTKWTCLHVGTTFTTEVGYGDWGYCLRAGGNATSALTKQFPDAQNTWIIGFAYKTPAASGDQAGEIVKIGTWWQGWSSEHAMLYWSSTDKKIRVYTAIGSDIQHETAVLSSDTWYYIEFKIVLNTTSGSWELRINNVKSGDDSGIKTAASDGGEVISFPASQKGAIDDIYILDGQAGANDFLGACKVFTHNPIEDAGINQWTPTPSGDHYATIDETPTSIVDYLGTNVNGYQEVFNFEDAVHAGTIHGVQAVGQFFVPDGAFKQAKIFCDSNGSIDSNSYYIASADVPSSVISISETDPDTGNAWTNTILNDATFGVEKVS